MWNINNIFREGKWYKSEEEYQEDVKKKARREWANGPDPIVDPYCECGAKHTQDPNFHSHWCKVYKPIMLPKEEKKK